MGTINNALYTERSHSTVHTAEWRRITALIVETQTNCPHVVETSRAKMGTHDVVWCNACSKVIR